MAQTFYNLDDVMSTYPKFFSPSNMRFFSSRLCGDLAASRYFVTSEKFKGLFSPDGPRLYTVREVLNGTISTVGKFQEFKTARQARARIDWLLLHPEEETQETQEVAA